MGMSNKEFEEWLSSNQAKLFQTIPTKSIKSRSVKEYYSFVGSPRGKRMLAIDLETRGISPFIEGNELISWVAADEELLSDYHIALDDEEKRPDLELGDTVVGHNLIAFDWPWLVSRDLVPKGVKLLDTLVMQSIIDENADASLDDCVQRWLGEKKYDPGVKPQDLWKLPPDELLEYNRSDTVQALFLAKKLKSVVEERGLDRLLKFKMDVGKVLSKMTVRGINFDKEYALEQRERIENRVKHLEEKLNEFAGREINWNSHQQVAKLLFDDFKLPTGLTKNYKTPERSTGKEAVKALISNCHNDSVKEFLETLLEYRIKSRLWSTYLKPLLEKHLGKDGKIHTFYHLAGTVTGRLSSSSPNLQNIAKDPIIGGCFIPQPGWKLGIWDYKQLELVLAAWLAGEDKLLEAFDRGQDLHTAVLADMKGVSYEEAVNRVKSGEWETVRGYIKNVHFGVLYGGSAHAIVRQSLMAGIKISYKNAQKMIDDWYAKYPKMKAFIENTLKEVRNTGKVVGPTGQTRRLPEAAFGNKRAERQAVNSLIQGFAAQVTLAALLSVSRQLYKKYAKTVLTIHDSIVMEYDPEHEDYVKSVMNMAMTEGVQSILQKYFKFGKDLPLAVDEKLGLNRLVET